MRFSCISKFCYRSSLHLVTTRDTTPNLQQITTDTINWFTGLQSRLIWASHHQKCTTHIQLTVSLSALLSPQFPVIIFLLPVKYYHYLQTHCNK